MTPSATLRSRLPGAGTRRIHPVDVVAALAAVAAFVWLQGPLAPPATVGRLTIVNPTDYAVDVQAGQVEVGQVDAGSSVELRDVPDLGDRWTFHFTGQRVDGGETTVARDALEAAGWRLEVPASVGQRLTAAGAPPSP